MAISTNSIIHYTDTLENLKLILEQGFKIKYCYEKLQLGVGFSDTAHPMISFCDIPLSNAKQHFTQYGKYGIGLTKDWAFKNRINPVLYIDRHSSIAEVIHKLIKSKGQIEQIQRLKSCTKNYSGTVEKENFCEEEYRFYNEREWRFIPTKEDEEFAKCRSAISIPKDSYDTNKNKYNEQVSNYRIKFEPNDISYIIVQATSEISEIITFLRDRYRCTGNQFDVLLSKVCSTEQIEADY